MIPITSFGLLSVMPLNSTEPFPRGHLGVTKSATIFIQKWGKMDRGATLLNLGFSKLALREVAEAQVCFLMPNKGGHALGVQNRYDT
jgi:hypothetical protein